jgi:1,4-dihydroxy-2-naphthoate octaprenyltransferase
MPERHALQHAIGASVRPMRIGRSGVVLTLFLATRPAFLSVTTVAVLLGLSCAYYDLGRLALPSAVLTLVFALIAHAGVNVVNDYFDSLNGTDAANVDRVFPFTGGSRFIQNGLLTEQQTRRFGYALLTAVIPAGILLSVRSGHGLLLIGAVGLLSGWAYSASPLRLNSRGLGELCVVTGFLCIVVGTDYVQRRAFSVTPFAAGLPYALMVTNVLFINQFPDRAADIAAGKLHWVARLSPITATWGYLGIAVASAWLLTTSVLVRGCLPVGSLAALAAFMPTVFAFWQLRKYAASPRHLAPAIKATIVAALLHGVLLCGGLVA